MDEHFCPKGRTMALSPVLRYAPKMRLVRQNMLKKFIWILLIPFLLLIPRTYEVQVASAANKTPGEIKLEVIKKAIENKINPRLVDCIVSHESNWIPDKKGPEKGGYISRGLWQIHSGYWQDITNQQANDWEWSTSWALTQIKNGHINWWATRARYCSKIPVKL